MVDRIEDESVWQSGAAVLTRMLDGVDPEVIAQIGHAAGHVPDLQVEDAKARWVEHRLRADVTVHVDRDLRVGEAIALAERLRSAMHDHVPALEEALICFDSRD